MCVCMCACPCVGVYVDHDVKCISYNGLKFKKSLKSNDIVQGIRNYNKRGKKAYATSLASWKHSASHPPPSTL